MLQLESGLCGEAALDGSGNLMTWFLLQVSVSGTSTKRIRELLSVQL